MENIVIKDAYEHNLKHLDLDFPVEAFSCVTGCSGCGKSSLVFDTIYAESQRCFLEGVSGNVYGQKLMNKPHVGSIENLRPALNVSQNYYNFNPRSTIGTTTEISYYLRSLFALLNSTPEHAVSESLFSANNPKAFCPCCSGLGVELTVSRELLMPDPNKTLREGGIVFFKGAPDSKEQKTLEALCEHYGINIDSKVSALSESALNKLLYADDQIRYKLSYKEGRRRKQHFVMLRGVIAEINARTDNCDMSDQSGVYTKYMVEAPCHVCGGAKLRPEVLQYQVDGKSYDEVERMELYSLQEWLQNLKSNQKLSPYKEKLELVHQLVDGMLSKVESLMRLHLGYLFLSRTIPSLSDGERQRVRIASQMTFALKGLVYILDEPCKGLHFRDTEMIIKATQDLVALGNTVIAIEHNKRYIAAADHIVELGPVGGPEGGYLLAPEEMRSCATKELSLKEELTFKKFFELEDINFRNIHNQNARFPIGGITCITGISGSGKSTLATVVANCFTHKAGGSCGKFIGGDSIKRILQVNQSPIGKTPRSTVVSYLGIFDDIRALFAATTAAHKLKLSASSFSMNVKGGRCETCQGTGLQKIELNYLPSTYITCPDCGGNRFNDQVLSVNYQGLSIKDVLETPVSEMVDLFKDSKKITPVLQSMVDLGLGYLKLGQMSMNLSGGEAQRIKLAKALGTPSKGQNLYILDEPTSGLNDVDIDKFIKILLSLQKKKETVIIIEHNIRFIAQVADHIIDFGLSGGNAGGKIVVQGTPQVVFAHKASSLYELDKLSF